MTNKGCAFGPCEKSSTRGGTGCYLCDKVAAGLVNPAPFKKKETATKREHALTSKQSKKAKTT